MIIFVIFPLAHVLELIPLSPIPVLLSITSYSLYRLYQDGYFHTERLWRLEAIMGVGPRLLAFFTASAIALLAITWLFLPERLFSFANEKPFDWAFLMILYPFLSALPQEIVFRVFFFHRYQNLMSESSLIIFSTLLFGYMHIVYFNLPSVLLSTIGGYIFTLTWVKTRSLFCIALEHTLYGSVIFTIGLGKYFML